MSDLPPFARSALARRRWARVGAAVAGVGLTTFGIVTFVLILTRPEPVQGPGGAFPVGLAAAGIWLSWYGLWEIPAQIRALRAPAVLEPLRPVFALRRERGAFFLAQDVEHAWLVAGTSGYGELGIPMNVRDARRCIPGTRVAVHGELRPGRHVALRFGSEVMWPTGRVEYPPEDAVGFGERFHAPRKKRHKLFRRRHEHEGVLERSVISR